ncbi:MAG: cation-translocating P-type ATPase [Deinococcus sp.]|nr:cation-translocating P-type ATPase [Deinococcus sp.]
MARDGDNAVAQALWHTVSAEAALAQLGADTERGLTSAEAQRRLEQYGPNELARRGGKSVLRALLGQFADPLVLLLLAAAVVSLVIGEPLDAGAILIVVLLNGVIGFFTEYRAERAMQALQELGAPHALVIRDGERHSLPARLVVPGDVLVLEAGSLVSADARLVQAANLETAEAALTGESAPVAKSLEALDDPRRPLAERSTMVYCGTAVTRGSGRAVVVATGMATELGRIVHLTATAEVGATPLEAKLEQLGKSLIAAVLLLCAIVTVGGVLRGYSLLVMFETGIALAIAAVPEGLPAVATITLAIGMRRMARSNALIRKLQAVESLGSVTVICSDKTGTLTEGRMTARRYWLWEKPVTVTGEGNSAQGKFQVAGVGIDPGSDPDLALALRIGALCNSSSLVEEEGGLSTMGDPTEGALLVAARKAALADPVGQYPRLREIPFEQGRMATIHRTPSGGMVAYVKGAPEYLLELARQLQRTGATYPLGAEDRAVLEAANMELAAEGMRVLALAYRPVPHPDADPYRDLILVGLVGLIDPPRRDAKEAVAQCHAAGIRTVMITGDSPITARAIARELGITRGHDPVVVTGRELYELDSPELSQHVRQADVFARVTPEDKLRIVEVLQEQGETVAMTGDGVNDAPALKKAEIGVAMGKSGTDVAREAAEMVLEDDRFPTIVAAVKEGRVILANIQKVLDYLFSCNASEIGVMFLATVAGLPEPLLPLQILYINLVTDVFPALALSLEPPEPGIMSRPPRPPRAPLVPPAMRRSIVGFGLLLTAVTLGAFLWALWSGRGEAKAVTISFLTLSLTQLFHCLNTRSQAPLTLASLVANPYLIAALVLGFALKAAAVWVPLLRQVLDTTLLSAQEWGVVLLASLLPLVVGQIGKRLRWRDSGAGGAAPLQ